MKCSFCYYWKANGQSQMEVQKEIDIPFIPPIGMVFMPTDCGPNLFSTEVEFVYFFEDTKEVHIELFEVDFGECDVEKQLQWMIDHGWSTI